MPGRPCCCRWRPGPLQAGAAATLVGADLWHAAGFSGRGVRVVVVDSGFSGHEQAFADAVPPVLARSFREDGSLDGGSGHGLRAARIVREIAPGAELMLLSFSTVSELAEAVDHAIAEQADVISFSVGFVHNGPGDGSGAVNEIVDRAVEAGIVWTVAAGNWPEQHWAGPFSDDDGDGVHEYSEGEALNGRHYMAGDLISASLRWDEAWGAACSDYDLELFGPDGSLVQASRRVQDCDDDPVEGLRVLATESGHYSARIVAAPDAPAEGGTEHLLSLLLLGSPDRGEQLDAFVPAGSLSQPADHPGVISVGALAASGAIAPFSSGGPDGRRARQAGPGRADGAHQHGRCGAGVRRHVGLRSARRGCGRSARGGAAGALARRTDRRTARAVAPARADRHGGLCRCRPAAAPRPARIARGARSAAATRRTRGDAER